MERLNLGKLKDSTRHGMEIYLKNCEEEREETEFSILQRSGRVHTHFYSTVTRKSKNLKRGSFFFFFIITKAHCFLFPNIYYKKIDK